MVASTISNSSAVATTTTTTTTMRPGTWSVALVLMLGLLGWLGTFGYTEGTNDDVDGNNDNGGGEVEGPLEYAERLPKPGTDVAPPEPGEDSRLTVRLVIDAQLARDYLESVTRTRRARPARFTQNGPGGADGGLFADLDNYEYRYWYERGPFEVHATRNGLHVRSRFETNLDVRTRLLPQTPLIEQRLRDRRVDIGADLSVGVDEHWNLRVEVEEFHFEFVDPVSIEIGIPGGEPIVLADVTTYVEDELRDILEGRLPGLVEHVEGSVDLPAMVRHTWHRMLGATHPLVLPDEENPAQFALRPSVAAAGDVQGENGRLLIDIEVSCRPLLSLAELAYEPPEVPANGELQTNGEPFHVLTEVLLPLERLSQQLNAAIKESSDVEGDDEASPWRIEERNLWVQVKHANVTADGDELMVMLLVDSNLHPDRPARIGLLMRPELSEDGTTLTFEDLRMTDSTAQWWRSRYRMLPAEPMLERVAESLVFDLGPDLARVRERVSEVLNRTFPLDGGYQLRGEGNVDEPVRLSSIRVREAPGEAEPFEDEDDPRQYLTAETGAIAVLYVDLVGHMLAHIEPLSE